MEHQAEHGSDGHGKVVGKAEIAESLAATLRREDVDDDGAATYRGGAEGQAVGHAEEGEEGERAGKPIPGKDGCEHRIGHEVERLAGKHVDEIAREGAYAECRDGVAREDDADERALGRKHFGQIEGEHGDQHPKPEEHQEIGCQHEAVAGGEEHFG